MNLPEPTVKYHIQLFDRLTKRPTGQILVVSESTYYQLLNLTKTTTIDTLKT